LGRLIEYFGATADEKVVREVAERLLRVSVTYKAVQGGKSVVSVMERGKKNELEVPTDKLEKLIMLANHYLYNRSGHRWRGTELRVR